MTTIAEKIAAAQRCCRKNINRKTKDSREFYERFFDGKWNVFVVKRDRATGTFVGKTACRADYLV